MWWQNRTRSSPLMGNGTYSQKQPKQCGTPFKKLKWVKHIQNHLYAMHTCKVCKHAHVINKQLIRSKFGPRSTSRSSTNASRRPTRPHETVWPHFLGQGHGHHFAIFVNSSRRGLPPHKKSASQHLEPISLHTHHHMYTRSHHPITASRILIVKSIWNTFNGLQFSKTYRPSVVSLFHFSSPRWKYFDFLYVKSITEN